MTDLKSINKRYSALATESCCLSCGSALGYAAVQIGEVAVDLGSGRGTDAMRMAEAVGPEGFVYGIDIADGMLKTARETAARLGLSNVKFVQSELEDLPLPDASVDVLISNCTLNHAADKQKVWDEIHRVLRPGGRFVVADIYSSAPVPEKYATDPEAVAECWAGAIVRERYMSILRQAGFAQLEVLEESKPYPKGEIEVSSFTIAGRKAL